MRDSAAVMRVAVTVEQSWHRVPGGTAWSTIQLLTALQAGGGIDLVGVAARHREPPPEGWEAPIPVRHLPLPRPALYETWHFPVAPFPKVEQVTGSVDVVHATAVAYPAARAPVVVTVHDLAFLSDARLATRHGMRFFRRGTELARERARIVVCPSAATRDECIAVGFAEDRLRVVPWGIRARAISDHDVERLRSERKLPDRYVLFSGTVEPRKNLPALLRAFQAVEQPDVKLVLAGPGGWNEDITPLVAQLGDRVRALGFVPRDELDALVAGAAVVCYPSLREGFGLPVLEAMAQGVPVVTSVGTATEEVAGDAALLVDPRDVAALGAAIERLLADDGLARELSERGRARAAAFTWEAAAAGYLDAYAEAAA